MIDQPYGSCDAPPSGLGTTVVVRVSSDHLADWLSLAAALGTFAVALGTILLALKTSNLAEQTKDMAAEAKREADASFAQVELTGAALNASTRPWLTLPPEAPPSNRHPDGNQPSLTHSTEMIWIEVRLENVGNGLALIDPKGITVHPRTAPQDGPASRNGQCDYAVVPPNRIVQLTFGIDTEMEQPPWKEIGDFSGADSAYAEFSVEVKYADAAGGQLGERGEDREH